MQDMGGKSSDGAAGVEAYFTQIAEPARGTLEKMREMIRKAAPAEATEAIGYGIPTFRYKGKGLVAYAAFKGHCSFFPMSLGVIDLFKTELEGYEVSKGTIRFAVDKPLAAGLVKKMVKARVEAVREKASE